MRTEQPHDRRMKRREQTREQLIQAAKTLFARQGVEQTRINEITEEADVGFGSFYNHFESKDDISRAVVSEMAAAHADAIIATTSGIEDSAEVISVAHRYFVRLASQESDWAWLALRLELSHRAILKPLRPYARQDLERAVTTGRLRVPDIDVAIAASGGALIGVMREVLEGRLGEGADVPHAAGVLQMFGLAPDAAVEVASRPMPRRDSSATE